MSDNMQMHYSECRETSLLHLTLESNGFQDLLAQNRAPVHVARYFNFLSAQPKFASVSGTRNVEKVASDSSSSVGQVLNYCEVVIVF